MVIEAVDEWKRTGILPNGEFWKPESENIITEDVIRKGVNGIPVSSFSKLFL